MLLTLLDKIYVGSKIDYDTGSRVCYGIYHVIILYHQLSAVESRTTNAKML